MTAAALHAEGITAGYAGVPALRDFDLRVEPGEVVALLGANGAGKTTALLSMVGAISPMTGQVRSYDTPLTGRSVDAVARLGVALVPDDRGVFFDLTVAEHLRLARVPRDDPAREDVLDRFPQLRPLQSRRCGLLSGGEQQMLALAKMLVARPRVLLIDELSLGLAPRVVQGLLPTIRRLATDHDMAVVLVEQHVGFALRLADRAVVLNRGRISLAGPAAELNRRQDALQAAYFGRNGS